MRAVVQEIVKQLLRKSFVVWERLGIHVTPDYFESPIADTRCLNEEIWSKRSNLTGIDMREREQINCSKRSWISTKMITNASRVPRLAAPISITLTTVSLRPSMGEVLS
jgi:hypothetical protein